jgi:hypothetical protein
MKLWLTYLSVFGLGIISFIIMISTAESPETAIVGEWKELTWEYEKVDKVDSLSETISFTSDNIKEAVAQHLVIHQAEIWTFLPNGRLKLQSNDSEKFVTWRIKGRGDILQIKHDNNIVENYNLTKLDSNQLVINFEADIQARGIAKLTFQKI